MTTVAPRGTTIVSNRAGRRIADRAATGALPAHRLPAARGSATLRGRRAAVARRITLPYPVPFAPTGRTPERPGTGRTRVRFSHRPHRVPHVR
ncbi:hypothetical protein [Streptomyces siamensis]|uniref:Uncharacterized protein n=1 Tax=Streptomyces siamensis TaxID=1274986 RepID=A0ABP9J6W9_9ACTN